MSSKVYEYKSCSTCQKARKFLDEKGVKYELIPIVEQPPTATEIKRMLSYLKSEDQAIQILSKNGKLIKRPFLLTSTSRTVGFKADVWAKLIK